MQILSLHCPALGKEAILPLLKGHSIQWNPYFLQYIEHPNFHLPSQDEHHEVYIGTLAEFGLQEPSNFPRIRAHIEKIGYSLPPAHLGIALRLALAEQEQSTNSQLSGQKKSPQGALVLLSAPLEEDVAVPRSLYLRNVDGQLWLRASIFDDIYEFPPDTIVAFVREAVSPQSFAPIRNEAFYKTLSHYFDCFLDYVLLQSTTPHQGLASHKAALISAMAELNIYYMPENRSFSMDESLLSAKALSPATFFAEEALPQIQRKGLRAYNPPEEFSYHYAFSYPPSSRPLSNKAFAAVNAALFPKGRAHLEIYEWTPNFSNYFEAGLEYWGAALWTVYDSLCDNYVVIGASATD